MAWHYFTKIGIILYFSTTVTLFHLVAALASAQRSKRSRFTQFAVRTPKTHSCSRSQSYQTCIQKLSKLELNMSIKTAIPNYPATRITTLKMNTTNQKTAKRVLKKYQGVARRRAAAQAYWRIKKLVPSIKSKENISKLDVVLEAISYIQSLQGNLEATLSSRQFY